GSLLSLWGPLRPAHTAPSASSAGSAAGPADQYSEGERRVLDAVMADVASFIDAALPSRAGGPAAFPTQQAGRAGRDGGGGGAVAAASRASTGASGAAPSRRDTASLPAASPATSTAESVGESRAVSAGDAALASASWDRSPCASPATQAPELTGSGSGGRALLLPVEPATCGSVAGSATWGPCGSERGSEAGSALLACEGGSRPLFLPSARLASSGDSVGSNLSSTHAPRAPAGGGRDDSEEDEAEQEEEARQAVARVFRSAGSGSGYRFPRSRRGASAFIAAVHRRAADTIPADRLRARETAPGMPLRRSRRLAQRRAIDVAELSPAQRRTLVEVTSPGVAGSRHPRGPDGRSCSLLRLASTSRRAAVNLAAAAVAIGEDPSRLTSTPNPAAHRMWDGGDEADGGWEQYCSVPAAHPTGASSLATLPGGASPRAIVAGRH
ncbi:unnamed protein product, partial [Symbiodinium sp. KB8]